MNPEINSLRREIDELDNQIAALFAKRFEKTDRIGALKRSDGSAVLDAGREQEVLSKFTPDVAEIYRTVMSVSRRRQSGL